jgi:hypothetical protein
VHKTHLAYSDAKDSNKCIFGLNTALYEMIDAPDHVNDQSFSISGFFFLKKINC